MAQILKKGSKRKYGITPAYTPQYHPAPTAEATLPLWQPNGVKFVTKEDFEWLIKNGHIDMKIPDEVKDDSKEADPQS